MATGGSQTRTTEPKRLLCAVCLERYKRPKLLPCFHTFCEGCLSSLAPPPSPSFQCPACRVTVTVPPGGVADFQTNFYIEEDIASEESRNQRKCDVCTSGHVAQHKCVDCQQFYCDPCLAIHNTFTINRTHRVLSVSDKEAASEEPKPREKCKLHPDQAETLYCKPCAKSICMLCKLTSHEGHASEDVDTASTRVRQRLQDMLAMVARRARELEVEEKTAQTMAENVRAEQKHAETELQKRKARVVEWAEQGCQDAMEAARVITSARIDSLKTNSQKASEMRAGVVAKMDHIQQALARGNPSELLQLQGDLNLEIAEPLKTKAVGRTSDVTTEKPIHADVRPASDDVPKVGAQGEDGSSDDRASCLQLHWDDNALSQASVLQYIGKMVSVHGTCMMPLCSRIGSVADARSEASASAASPQTFADKSRAKVGVNMQSASKLSSSSELQQPLESEAACEGSPPTLGGPMTRNFLEVEKQHARSGVRMKAASIATPSTLRYSENPQARVNGICLTNSNKLWITYQADLSSAEVLALYDSDGTHLGIWRENFPRMYTSLTSVGDVLVFLYSIGKDIKYESDQNGFRSITSCTWTVRIDWFGPDGRHGYSDAPHVNIILFSQNSDPLYGLLYQESCQEYHVHGLSLKSFYPLSVASDFIVKTDINSNTLYNHATCGQTVASFDVSVDGLFFAFSVGGTITVYYRQEKTASLAHVCSSGPNQFPPNRTFFCQVGNQELLAAQRKDNRIVAQHYHDGLTLKKQSAEGTATGADKVTGNRSGIFYIAKSGGWIHVFKLGDA